MTKRATALRTALLPLAVALAAATTGSPAHAHGTLVVPESRIHRCAFDGNVENHQDPACRAAIDLGGKQPMYDWNGVRQGDANGDHRAVVPDGRLCGGGNAEFTGLDLPRADWRTRPIAPDANGRFEFVWHATAPHATRDWHLYLTRDGWDATQPLRWSDLDEFCASGAVPLDTDAEGRQVYRIDCPLPQRSGRQAVFVTWQRSDSPEAFYACSDVEFTGGTAAGWKQIGVLRAADKLPLGSVVTFRLFDGSGADLERIDVELGKGQTSRRAWALALARRVNATSALVRIGLLQAGGEIAPVKSASANLVYGPPALDVRFAIDVTPPGGGGLQTYPDGIGTYGPGTIVRGTDGLRYQCRPFPNSGWCNQAPAAYAPGSGSAWADAWTQL